MSVLVYKDKAIAGAAASTLIAAQIIEKPSSCIGFDYAEDLLPVYRAIARMSKDGLLDWSDVRVFNLSERVRADADASIDSELWASLYENVNVVDENCFHPKADTNDWALTCNAYENAILDRGGLDMVFLNVAADGSVAYNLGADELAPVTHVERTENGRIVTVGIATIMSAKKVVAFIAGKDKAGIAGSVFHGPVTPNVPASYLQLHPNAVFLLDDDAAKEV